MKSHRQTNPPQGPYSRQLVSTPSESASDDQSHQRRSAAGRSAVPAAGRIRSRRAYRRKLRRNRAGLAATRPGLCSNR
eukprot:295156-Hanusia_phi.AAC.1